MFAIEARDRINLTVHSVAGNNGFADSFAVEAWQHARKCVVDWRNARVRFLAASVVIDL